MTYDPSANDYLESLRRTYPERDERDRPDWVAESVDDNGSVRVRPLTFDDIVDWCERETRGMVE